MIGTNSARFRKISSVSTKRIEMANSLVTTTLSLGVEIGVGELLGWGLVKLASEGRVLLGDEEDKDHVDDGKTGEGPSETHDTLGTLVFIVRANERE